MADMSQVNLERIRATDAMWEESKHPRSENGQFTSGSGSVLATGGGGKFSKPTQSMTGGKFKKPNQEAAKAIAQGYQSGEKPQATVAKAAKELKKEAAAKQTLTKAKGKINAMRSLAEAATSYHAENSAESVAKFNSVAKMLKNVDSDAYKYAVKMAKIAESDGEEAAMEWAERQQKEIDASGMNPVAKGYHKGRLGIVLREYNKGGLKQRKDAMEIKSMEEDIDKKKAEYNEARKSFAPVDKIHKLREELDQMKHDYRAARFPKQYGSQGGGGAAPAEKPKRDRKPKVEKDWEPNEAEQASWRVSYSNFYDKKFNPKKATPKQMENRIKQAEHVIKMLKEESAHTPRYGGGGANEKHWRYVNDLRDGVERSINLDKMRYEDAHKEQQ